jgi:AAA ATPase domain
LEYAFSNGNTVKVLKTPSETAPEAAPASLGIRFAIYSTSNGEGTTWEPHTTELQRSRLQQLERYLPFLSRDAPDRWVHDQTGQAYNFAELIEAFRERVPQSFHSDLYSDEPPTLTELIGEIDCHLIETQRLLIFPEQSQSGFRPERRRPSSILAISEKAELLKSIIATRLTRYATLSQSLDRSFPKRAIQEWKQEWKAPAFEDLRKRLEELDAQRSQLMDAGILDAEGVDPVNLPPGDFEAGIARVLSVYAVDTKQKLDSLSQLLERIQLFKGIIEKRFRIKKVEVDKQAGFKIRYKGRIVPLEKSSSGEQHQLVLFFELLFELRSNALILIDEPELSLHVTWQKEFISDLKSIISLSAFDVILATHSPQLIAAWEELIVELGDVETE